MDPCRPPGPESTLGSSAPTASPPSPGKLGDIPLAELLSLHMRPVAAGRAESEGTKRSIGRSGSVPRARARRLKIASIGRSFAHVLERQSRSATIAGRGQRAISALSFGAYAGFGTINGCIPGCGLSAMRSAGVVCAGGQVHGVGLEVSVAGCAAEASPADRVVRAEEARGSTHGRSSSGSRRRQRAAWPRPRRTG